MAAGIHRGSIPTNCTSEISSLAQDGKVACAIHPCGPTIVGKPIHAAFIRDTFSTTAIAITISSLVCPLDLRKKLPEFRQEQKHERKGRAKENDHGREKELCQKLLLG